MAADNALSFTLKKAGYTSVTLTGTRGVSYGTSNATVTLTNGSETVTYTATMEGDIDSKDYEITGLTSGATYSITYSGDYVPSSVSSVTTLADEPRVATESQWEDLAERVKNAGGLSPSTTFWGQTASGGVVSGNIVLGGASTDHPKTVGLNDNGAKIDFGYDSPDNGFDYVRVKATNTTTNKSATLEVMAENNAYISSDAPLHMGSNKITDLANGTANTDAVTKGQMDTAISGVGGVKKAGTTAWTPTVLQYIEEKNGSVANGAMFYAGEDMSDEPYYVGIGANGVETPADGYGPRPYMITSSVTSTGGKDSTFAKRIPLFVEMEDRILAGGTSAPTTSTAGKVGTLYAYVESGTGHLAICTEVDTTTDPSNPSYTWQTLI